MKIFKKIILIIITLGLLILFLAYLSSRGRIGIETTLVRNIKYNGEKISIIEGVKKAEKETVLVVKKNGEKIELDTYLQNNEIPVDIIDAFIFKSKTGEYIVAITNSYVKVNNEVFLFDGYGKDIYIYNSQGDQMFGFEEELYEIEFDDRYLIIQKLQELEKEGKL